MQNADCASHRSASGELRTSICSCFGAHCSRRRPSAGLPAAFSQARLWPGRRNSIASRDPHAPLSNSFESRLVVLCKRWPQHHDRTFQQPLVCLAECAPGGEFGAPHRASALALGYPEACSLQQYLTLTGVAKCGETTDVTPCLIRHWHHPTHYRSTFKGRPLSRAFFHSVRSGLPPACRLLHPSDEPMAKSSLDNPLAMR